MWDHTILGQPGMYALRRDGTEVGYVSFLYALRRNGTEVWYVSFLPEIEHQTVRMLTIVTAMEELDKPLVTLEPTDDRTDLDQPDVNPATGDESKTTDENGNPI
jgi:hypothetical protein